ncbi:MAG: LysM domain-containing protein [bacterium]|nr:LysM domain-containing protein [bacterium]
MDRICFCPFSLVFFLILLVFLTGCASFPRQEISDAWILVEAAKDSCAKVYMPEELEEATVKLDAIEAGSQKPNRKSKKELTAMALEVQALAKGMVNDAARTKKELHSQVQEKMVVAIQKIHEAEEAEANRYGRQDYRDAIFRLSEARELAGDECRYREALVKADESIAHAEASIQRAGSFKVELEENLPQYHIVRRGETLKTIARDSPLYRDESYWELIYKANRDQIRDPRILYPGQQLYLPRK